jgi:hypothetical protein
VRTRQPPNVLRWIAVLDVDHPYQLLGNTHAAAVARRQRPGGRIGLEEADSEEPCLRGMAYCPFHRTSESASICSHGQTMDTSRSEISTTRVGAKAQLTRRTSPTLTVSFMIDLPLPATCELHRNARLA